MADSRTTQWWRIEVCTLEGVPKVISCEAVEAPERDTTDVFYLRASSREQAGRRAWSSYTNRQNRRRRAAYISEGRCGWCGRANDRDPTKRCSVCLRNHVGHKARSDARARGEVVAPPDRAATIAARAQEQRQEIRAEASEQARISVLLEVQEAWRDATSNHAFTRWLAEAISGAVPGKKVA